MKVEVLILIILVLMFLIWSVWYRWSTKRLLKNFKPDDDRSKKPEGIGKGGERGITAKNFPFGKFTQPSERSVLETASINSIRKNSKRTFNPFRRRKKI